MEFSQRFLTKKRMPYVYFNNEINWFRRDILNFIPTRIAYISSYDMLKPTFLDQNGSSQNADLC